jgi:hypothetical protein
VASGRRPAELAAADRRDRREGRPKDQRRRLERLQAAAEALNGVLAEVVEIRKRPVRPRRTPVEKNELVAAITEAITKAQEPLIARLEALEKSVSTPPPPARARTTSRSRSTGIAEAIEQARRPRRGAREGPRQRTSVAGQDGGGEVKKRPFAGMFD